MELKICRWGRWVFSLLLSLLNCEQFHSLEAYWTSVFPLTLPLSSWKFNRAACPLQNSCNSNIAEENCYTRPNPVSKTQNRHETEPECSLQIWTSVFMNRNSAFLLCLPISNWNFHRAASFEERVCSSVEPLSQIERFSAPSWRVGKAVRNYTVCMGIRWQKAFSKIKFYAIDE